MKLVDWKVEVVLFVFLNVCSSVVLLVDRVIWL